MKDVTIIGGGPAGAAAGVYASRKRLHSTLITSDWGGQSVDSTDIQNWIGTVSMTGQDWANMLEEHVRAYANDVVTIVEGDRVTTVEKHETGFVVTSEKGSTYESRAVLVATGSTRRKLDIPGANTFDNKGVMYCASCDGPVFADQDVAVVGGGNAGFESAAELSAYCKSVTLLHRRNEYKADPITVEKVLAKKNVTAITPVEPTEIKGHGMVNGLIYKNRETGEQSELNVTGIFVEIGLIPTTDFVADLVELTDDKHIKIDPWHQTTSVDGVWAAGDCTNVLYHQNNIAAGNAVTAIEDIYRALEAK